MGSSFLDIATRPGVLVGGLAIAFFLVLTWVLRGTPLGQAIGDEPEGEGRPEPGRRDRAVMTAVSGLLLVAIGAYVAFAVGVLWSVPVFAVGYALVARTIHDNRPFRHASPTLRRVVNVSDTAMTASLIAGVLVVGNVLAFRYGERPLDFTTDKVYSLASLTVNQLKALDRPVRFTVFLGQTPRARRQLGRILQLLDLYKDESPNRISIDVVHPASDQIRFEELAKRVPEVAVTPGGGVAVEFGEGDSVERTVVRNGEMFDVSDNNAFETDRSRIQTSFHGEDALTSALIRLQEEKKPKIAFVTGHGELSIHEMELGKNGLGALRELLAGQGAEILVVNLTREPIPADASVVVLAAPSTEFSPEEAKRLQGYMKNGGRLMMFLDSRAPEGLRNWLKSEFHVTVGTDPVYDGTYNIRGQWNLVIAPIVGDSRHPIVEPLLNRGAAMPVPTALSLDPPAAAGAAMESPFHSEIILRSSQESWVETDAKQSPPQFDPNKDKRGPIALGVAVYELPKHDARGTGEEEIGRLVVFGSSSIASNWFLSSEFANRDVVVNSVNWLRGKPNLAGISPKTHTSLRLAGSPALRDRLVSIPTLMAVLVIVGLGAATYYNRRS
jgi:ABC-type uncharacterized transport system